MSSSCASGVKVTVTLLEATPLEMEEAREAPIQLAPAHMALTSNGPATSRGDV